MDKVVEVREQLRQYLVGINFEITSCGRDLKQARKALTAGFFLHAAQKVPQKRQYRTLFSNRLVFVHPTSLIRDPLPEYVIFNRLVLTSKEYIRDINVIDNAWLSEVAPKAFAQLEAAQAALGVKPAPSGKVAEPDWKSMKQAKKAAKPTPATFQIVKSL
jgi:ATP-dependent RNA helicase DHX8/PRP22